MFFLLCLAGILAMGFSDCNDNNKDSKEATPEKNENKYDDRANEKDSQLVVDLMERNYAEIKMVQLAKERSTSTEVKDLANYLETEHKEVLSELKDLAGKKGIAIPIEENDKSKDKIKVLSDIKADEFDTKWCKELMDKHKNQ
jgi:putative membrane protein